MANRRLRFAFTLCVVALACLGSPPTTSALIFENPESDVVKNVPPDFPFWDHVTQRRYDGPSVVYLGAGWALTAKHVGRGEIFLKGQIYPPNAPARHTLLNSDGSAADIMVFQLDEEAGLPDLPLLPLAVVPPANDEEVLMIGFGRVRQDRIEAGRGETTRPAFRWSEKGEKRWGRNRVESNDEWLVQDRYVTRAFVTRFERSIHPRATEYEASAALGDSGGAVFVRRDGGWKLAGLMTSVSSGRDKPAHSTTFGDLTYISNLSLYREEILRWTRPRCANGLDDDGDGETDFPDDPDCISAYDEDERTRLARWQPYSRTSWMLFGWGLLVTSWALWRIQRGRRTDKSTRISSAS